MSKPSPPAAPDYTGAAQAQGAANMDAARLQNTASKVNQYTPYGNQVYTPVPGSKDQWQSNITLAPAQQGLLNAQNNFSTNLAGVAGQNIGRVGQAESQPFSMGGLPGLSGGPSGYGNVVDASQFGAQKDKAYSELMGRQNQQFDTQDKAMQQQLANQGIAPGSEAWNRAYQPLNQARVDASNQSDLSANNLQQSLIAQANQAQQQKYGQAYGNAGFQNQSRGQGIQEREFLRSQPLNELNALRTGAQVTNPTFSQYNSAQYQPAPVFQGAQAQGNAANQAYSQQLGASNNMLSGLFGLGSAAIASPYALF